MASNYPLENVKSVSQGCRAFVIWPPPSHCSFKLVYAGLYFPVIQLCLAIFISHNGACYLSVFTFAHPLSRLGLTVHSLRPHLHLLHCSHLDGSLGLPMPASAPDPPESISFPVSAHMWISAPSCVFPKNLIFIPIITLKKVWWSTHLSTSPNALQDSRGRKLTKISLSFPVIARFPAYGECLISIFERVNEPINHEFCKSIFHRPLCPRCLEQCLGMWSALKKHLVNRGIKCYNYDCLFSSIFSNLWCVFKGTD